MKNPILLMLKFLSIRILRRYKPKIIGVTGSVGKTTGKEAIYAVLKDKKKVRRSVKNYNNEIGLPLTIIGADSPGRSVLGWAKVFIKGLAISILGQKDYPKVLILEMGVDHPGDMDYLLKIAKPDVGVLTLIGSVHVENFSSLVRLREEKIKLIEAVCKDGWSLINIDNDEAKKAVMKSKARVLSYGLDKRADINASEIIFSFENERNSADLRGISFKLYYQGSYVPVLLPRVLGVNAVYAALAGAAVGITQGMNLHEIAEALRDLVSPKGRMNLVEGIKKTMIIDDTYNAEPESMISAIGVIKRVKVPAHARKFVVLGDMLELGSLCEEAHKYLGKLINESDIYELITVGERSLNIGHGAKEAGMQENNIFHFSNSIEAGKFLDGRIKPGDLILVKGSQGMRMEKTVLEIMADPAKAKDLLVRQDELWGQK